MYGAVQSSGVNWTSARMLVVLTKVMELQPLKAKHGQRQHRWEHIASYLKTHPAFKDDKKVETLKGPSVRAREPPRA